MKVSEYKKLVKPSEHSIQTEIINFLRGQEFYVQRLNAGGYAMEGRGFVRGVRAGTPDIMAIRKVTAKVLGTDTSIPTVQVLFVEVKAQGKKPTVLQEQVMEELRTHGAHCIVAHSVREVEEQL